MNLLQGSFDLHARHFPSVAFINQSVFVCACSGQVFFLRPPLCPAAQRVDHGQVRPAQHVDLEMLILFLRCKKIPVA